jgi:bacitracin transport ATP-binding protein BcrA
MKEALKIINLCKTISKREILKNINLTVNTGEAVGIVGANGSGKSMLFKAICNLITPTSGEVYVFGERVGTKGKFPSDVGVLIESPGFLPNLSGFNNLSLLASIRNNIKKEDVENAIALVGLDPKDKRPTKKYSMGMRQRLNIAQALMEKPKFLILDEPMNGLDRQGVADIHALLKKLREEEKLTLLLTSHHPEDIEALCDKVYIMDNGMLSEE